jgi:hypothetical protein
MRKTKNLRGELYPSYNICRLLNVIKIIICDTFCNFLSLLPRLVKNQLIPLKMNCNMQCSKWPKPKHKIIVLGLLTNQSFQHVLNKI